MGSGSSLGYSGYFSRSTKIGSASLPNAISLRLPLLSIRFSRYSSMTKS